MLHTKRERFEFLRKLVVNVLGKLPITPNQWTLLSLLFAFIALYFTIVQYFFFALFFFLISLSLDFVDGVIARARGIASNSGAYLDTIIDRYVEGIMLLGILFIPFFPTIIIPLSIWVFLALFGSMITTYSKAATGEKEISKEAIKKTLESRGLVKRAERVILLFLIYLSLAFGYFDIALYILILLALLTNITAVRKIIKFIKYNNQFGAKIVTHGKDEKILN